MSKYTLKFYFMRSVNPGEWHYIADLFYLTLHKNLGILINKMEDVNYKEVQLINPLTSQEETFLRGLMIGFFRGDIVIIDKIDKYGNKLIEF